MAESKSEHGEKKMTKYEAVRQAMLKLGMDTGRTELKEYIEEKFGLEMSLDHISTTKADLVRKGKLSGAGSGDRAATVEGENLPRKRGRPASTNTGIEFEELLALRNLVKRLGHEQVRQIIDNVIKE